MRYESRSADSRAAQDCGTNTFVSHKRESGTRTMIRNPDLLPDGASADAFALQQEHCPLHGNLSP